MSTPQHSSPAGAGAPPHSIEAEQSVLGAILLSERVHYAFVIEEGLKPEDFYRDRHRVIYESMLALYEQSEPLDVLTVTEHLRSRGKLEEAGGNAEIDALSAAVPAVGNLRRYGQIVKEQSLLRRLLGATYEIQAAVHGHEAGPRELVERAERVMLEVAHDDRQKDFVPVGDVLHAEIAKWQELSSEGRSLTGTPSGFTDLDTITGGFQPGNLIIVAARPSMGKCLRGATLVYDPVSGARRRLDDVVDDVESGEEAFVASVGADLKLHVTKVGRAWRNGVKPVLELTTRLGRKISATSNHPLLTLGGWRELGELRPGDRIAVPRRLPRAADGQTMPDHELVLLAALIADGDLTQSSPRLCFGAESPVLDEVRDAADAIGVRLSRDEPANTTAILSAGRGATHNPVRDLCTRHGLWGKRSADKVVPDAIFGLHDGQIARFLAVLFACDGHVHAGRLRQVGYSTISERLARDVQHLLLRLGIVSTIRTLKRDVYGGDEVAREVRITHQEPRVLAAKGEERWAAIGARTGRAVNDDWRVGTRGVSRGILGELAEATGSEELGHLASSDIWWDEIVSIEPAGEEETYDLEVPGDHNFVADDLIVHNSALVTNIAENVALNREKPRPVALFSLEMSEAELAQRFVASQASIKGDDLRKGRLRDEAKWKRVLKVAAEYNVAPLYIDDSSDMGILDVRAKARRLHQQTNNEYGGLGLIIVDYLQLLRGDSRVENRVQQVGEISRGLKILARELNVPVIALSQLSRGVESRTDKRPMLSDLRECVTGDTLVVLADGRRIPIRDLVGTRPEVVAVDEEDRLVTARADLVWPVGQRKVFRVRLASGRSMRASAEHRIRTGTGWKAVADIGPGDRVALARRLPEPVDCERWPVEHVVLLGQLVGDGSYLPGRPLRYTTSSHANSDAVREAAERGFGAKVSRHQHRPGWHQLVLSGNGNRRRPAGVNAWLRGLGIFGQRSSQKRIPGAAFRLPDDQVALLLRHLWATDGSISTGHRHDGRRIARVAYSTTSRGLAADVAALLLRLGIVARTTTTRDARPMHHVLVSGAPAQRTFLERVGAFGPRVPQADALARLLETTHAVTNADTLTLDISQEVRASVVAQGISQRAVAAMGDSSYGGASHFAVAPSRETIAGYAALLDAPVLTSAAAGDLFWDRVIAVEPAGEEEVFDLTVPGPACWLADGIVSHNSGQIEQDADLVMFIYRDEYYNPETTDRPGEAELIIAKHRNGGLGDVPLSFQNEYPRFLSLQRAA